MKTLPTLIALLAAAAAASAATIVVTSGTGGTDPEAGSLFDATLSGGSFSHTFTSAGDVPYFCHPHEGLGMTGIVRVDELVAEQGATFSALKSLFR